MSLLDERICWSGSGPAAATACENGLLRQVAVALRRGDRAQSPYADVSTLRWQVRTAHTRLMDCHPAILTGA